MSRPRYEHTQAGWPIRVSFLAGAALFLVMTQLPELSRSPTPVAVLVAGAVFTALLGWTWGSLAVRIQGDELQVRFGFGWPRKTVKLPDIVSVEVTRTTFLEGWGVHRTRRGWLYNVSGFDAALLRLANGRSLLVGTDEPRRLKAAIERAQARA
jgi:MFS superfamily sulfate permease-like transporter